MLNTIGEWLWVWGKGWKIPAYTVSIAGGIGYYHVVGDPWMSLAITVVVALSHVIAYAGGSRATLEQTSADMRATEVVLNFLKDTSEQLRKQNVELLKEIDALKGEANADNHTE